MSEIWGWGGGWGGLLRIFVLKRIFEWIFVLKLNTGVLTYKTILDNTARLSMHKYGWDWSISIQITFLSACGGNFSSYLGNSLVKSDETFVLMTKLLKMLAFRWFLTTIAARRAARKFCGPTPSDTVDLRFSRTGISGWGGGWGGLLGFFVLKPRSGKFSYLTSYG